MKAADLPAHEPYGVGHASVYDDLYAGRGKNYAEESRLITSLIRARNRLARSLLDVGCGSGRHLEHLRDEFREVEGIEPAPDMRALAHARLPGIAISDQALPNIATGRTYDAVTCLFSVIGYVGGEHGSVEQLDRAIAGMGRHLNAGGVLIVEPWLSVDRYAVGHIGSDFTRTPSGRVIFRMSHSGITGGDRVSFLTMNYLVGTPEGIEHFSDVHLLTMFSQAEFAVAFRRAGLDFEATEEGFGRGLMIGVKKGDQLSD